MKSDCETAEALEQRRKKILDNADKRLKSILSTFDSSETRLPPALDGFSKSIVEEFVIIIFKKILFLIFFLAIQILIITNHQR